MQRKWKEECHDLRDLDAKELQKRVKLEQLNQLKLLEERRQKELEEQRYYDEMWEKDRQRKLAKEREDLERRKKQEVETIKILDEQRSTARQTKLQGTLTQWEEAQQMVRYSCLDSIEFWERRSILTIITMYYFRECYRKTNTNKIRRKQSCGR